MRNKCRILEGLSKQNNSHVSHCQDACRNERKAKKKYPAFLFSQPCKVTWHTCLFFGLFQFFLALIIAETEKHSSRELYLFGDFFFKKNQSIMPISSDLSVYFCTGFYFSLGSILSHPPPKPFTSLQCHSESSFPKGGRMKLRGNM